MTQTLSEWIQVVVDFINRFIAARPRNQYELAIFQALRSILITAFLKPLRSERGALAPSS